MLQGHFAKETIFASKEAQKNKSGPNVTIRFLAKTGELTLRGRHNNNWGN